MSSSIHKDGWLRTSLVFIDRRRADIASLPLLASSKRVRAREDEVVGEEGGGSGPYLFGGEDSGEETGKVVSGDEAVSGNQEGFKKKFS